MVTLEIYFNWMNVGIRFSFKKLENEELGILVIFLIKINILLSWPESANDKILFDDLASSFETNILPNKYNISSALEKKKKKKKRSRLCIGDLRIVAIIVVQLLHLQYLVL